VNCILGLHLALHSLFFMPVKGRYYTAVTLIVNVPVGFAAWLEANRTRLLGISVRVYHLTSTLHRCTYAHGWRL
jgi:hypothetical protein